MVQFVHDRASIVRNLYCTHRKEKIQYHPDLTGVDCSLVYEAMNEDFDWFVLDGWIRPTADGQKSYALTEKGWRWADEQEQLGLIRIP